METDPLRQILGEWPPPEVPASLDARVLAAYRERVRRPAWRTFWSARISVPVPALAAVLALAAAVFLIFQSRPVAPARMLRIESQLVSMPNGRGCITRLDATGFQALPDGDARVLDEPAIKRKEVKQ